MSDIPTWVAGVDGCPQGWICVLRPLAAPESAVIRFAAAFADVLQFPEKPATIAVDIPIGFPERIEGSGRSCERLVRKLLGPRQSSVFSTPARAVVHEEDYREGCALALTLSEPPRKISKQAFNLFPKIRELDALLTPELNQRIYECHPEVAFWVLNGCAPASLPKKVKSRPNPDGLEERRKLLVNAGYDAAFLSPSSKLPGRAGVDDLIDAAVCSWSAARIAHGEAVSFPDPPEWDAQDNRMAITV